MVFVVVKSDMFLKSLAYDKKMHISTLINFSESARGTLFQNNAHPMKYKPTIDIAQNELADERHAVKISSERTV